MTSLRQRMTEDMQVRNLSPNTQTSYVQQISQYARHFAKSPELLGPEDIRADQVYLTNERKLAPSSVIIAVAALRFLYKVTLHKAWIFEDVIPAPKQAEKLPVVLSPEEVLHFLACVPPMNHRTILTCCYAAGLRVSEALHLKATHIDGQRMVIRVEQGKGLKDRYVMLSATLLQILRDWWPQSGVRMPPAGQIIIRGQTTNKSATLLPVRKGIVSARLAPVKEDLLILRCGRPAAMWDYHARKLTQKCHPSARCVAACFYRMTEAIISITATIEAALFTVD